MPLLQRERQLKRRKEEMDDTRFFRLRYRPVVEDAVRAILFTGQSHRHAAWRLEQQCRHINGKYHLLRAFLKRLLAILDDNLEPNALFWSHNDGSSQAIRLVRHIFDKEKIGMKHGMILHEKAVSSPVLIKLLVKQCGFRVRVVVSSTRQDKVQPQHERQAHDHDNDPDRTIHELTHRFFRPGRGDLIARIRFFDLEGKSTKQNRERGGVAAAAAATASMGSTTKIQWPSGATASTIHLADERQYHSLLKQNPEKLWPESLDDENINNVDNTTAYNDEDVVQEDDAEVSLEDQELDSTWDKEVSDGIDPIQFSADRLTQVVPSHPANRVNVDKDTCDSLQRSRMLLLHTCWERAVHMANSTFTATIAAAPDTPEQPPPPARTRIMAEQTCRRWNLQPQDNTLDSSEKQDDQHFVCSVCRNRYSSEEQLEQHFYGTLSTEGCCWVGIAYSRRQFIRTALAKEVDVQRRLLLQAILERLPPSTSNDALGLLDTLEEMFRNSQGMRLMSNNQPVVSETLQVAPHLPPMILNHDVLESAQHRIVERYSMMRR